MEPNPFSLAARRDALEWFAQMGMVRDEGARRSLAAERLALCSGYLFPTANFEQLVTLVEFLGLWLFFDDLLLEGSEGRGQRVEADPTGADPEALPRGAFACGYPAVEPPLHAWQELCQHFTQQSLWWRNQLWDRFTGWVYGRAARHAMIGAPEAARPSAPPESGPDLGDDEIGATPAFYLIEYVGGFELPEEVRQHELMRALHAIGSRIMLWAHALIGLENAPPVHMSHEPEELSRIVELHNRHVFEFLDVERALPSFGDLQPFVDTYLQLMHFLIRGFAEWKLGAGRRDRTRPPVARRGSVNVSLSSFSEE
ncbi:MAG TPA: hypothetical protein VH877_27860 [Polyangia bacterium]|jgi:hypothetical protein|nr:hypothetical protein [Polyangia bacterium]